MMNEALLWFDDSGLELREKVLKAANRYRQKHGRKPNLCYVHPSALGDKGPQMVDGIRVAALPSVLRLHFWIGWEPLPNGNKTDQQ